MEEKEVISVKDAIIKDKESPFLYIIDKEPKSALIIRTARMWQIRSCIDLLKRAFSKVKVSILAQKSIQDELKRNPLIDELIPYNKDGRFNIIKLGIRGLLGIWKRKFDLFIIPYYNPVGKGYLNVETIALLSRIKEKLIYDNEGRVYRLDLCGWLENLPKRSIIIRFLARFLSPLGFAITIIYFLLLLLILKINDLIQAIKGPREERAGS
jgi:hypothetical protein